jgi:hypothetical protein
LRAIHGEIQSIAHGAHLNQPTSPLPAPG